MRVCFCVCEPTDIFMGLGVKNVLFTGHLKSVPIPFSILLP